MKIDQQVNLDRPETDGKRAPLIDEYKRLVAVQEANIIFAKETVTLATTAVEVATQNEQDGQINVKRESDTMEFLKF